MGETFHFIFYVQFSFFYLGDGGGIGERVSFFDIQFGFALRVLGVQRPNPTILALFGYLLYFWSYQNG